MERTPAESRIHVNGVELALWEWPGAEPAVLFCHGTSFHARCWDQVIARLSGRRCLAFDARGHGRSSRTRPPCLWRSFGQDAAAVAHWLKLRGAVGVGHSLGGYSIALAAALQPAAFSALLLLDPVIRPEEEYTGPWEGARFLPQRRNRWNSSEEMFERFRNRAPFDAWDREVLRDYCQYGLLKDGDSFVLACPPEVEAGIYENSSAIETNIYPELAGIRIPVRVIRAGKPRPPGSLMGASPTAPDLASILVQGSDLCLPQHSHYIPMEAPALTAQLITDLLTSH